MQFLIFFIQEPHNLENNSNVKACFPVSLLKIFKRKSGARSVYQKNEQTESCTYWQWWCYAIYVTIQFQGWSYPLSMSDLPDCQPFSPFLAMGDGNQYFDLPPKFNFHFHSSASVCWAT